MLRPREFPDTRPSLLGLLRNNEPQQPAWREFFECYAPPVYRVARLRGLSATDADDVVQQTMLAVSQHIAAFRYDRQRGRFRQWIRRIAENKITDLRRKPHTTAELSEQPDGQLSLAEIWEREWRMQDMLFCFDEVAADLSLRRVEAFRLYVLEGLPAAEVAARLKMTVGHVYVTRAQVLQRIRARLKQLNVEDQQHEE